MYSKYFTLLLIEIYFLIRITNQVRNHNNIMKESLRSLLSYCEIFINTNLKSKIHF